VYGALYRSRLTIPGMDCPAEVQMIRLRLAALPITALQFDLGTRCLTLDHPESVSTAAILQQLEPLGYGAALVDCSPLAAGEAARTVAGPHAEAGSEAKALRLLLAINALMFVLEGLAGWWANSVGLLADGADMFADAAVYGIALYAVGRDSCHQLLAARFAGLLQVVLALAALTETGRHFYLGSQPEAVSMMGISLLALFANIACLFLISEHREGGVHMQASYIFSANDVLANLGVILAGGLVIWTGSPVPDWIIGSLIGIIVFVGGVRILRLR
jgi:Co/Zn/Cd efflux system component